MFARGKRGPYSMEPMISIVDDDQSVREALQRMLRSHGFVTQAFASAEQFLNSEAPSHAACLILDVRMPGMTGLALHDRLTAQGNRIPTILVTACPTEGEGARAVANGAYSYLAKPFDEERLVATLRGALGPAELHPAAGEETI